MPKESSQEPQRLTQEVVFENTNEIIVMISEEDAQELQTSQERFPSRYEVIEGGSFGTQFEYEKPHLHLVSNSAQIYNQNAWDNDKVGNENGIKDGNEEIENGSKEDEDIYEVGLVSDDNEKMENEKLRRNGNEQLQNGNEEDRITNTYEVVLVSDKDLIAEEFSEVLEEEASDQLSSKVETILSEKPFQNTRRRQGSYDKKTRKNTEVHGDGDISSQYLCYICGNAYKQLSHLSRHTKSAHNKETFHQCTICETTFTRVGSLIRHLKLHEQRKGTTASKAPFKCPQCSNTYQQQYNVTRHLLTHTGEKPFKCIECDKTFTQHTGLSRHLILHRGSRDFKCDVCGKAFARQFVLTRHKLIHTEDKPYKCFVCSKSFIRGSQLKIHIASHQKADPWSHQITDETQQQ